MISAVIPTHHGAARLARNLGSVLASLEASGEPWEIVVVDDGGGDRFELPAAVRLLRLDRNRGYGSAVNAGVEAALGDYLLILNDDVRLEASCVSRLRGRFPERSLFAVVPAIRSDLAACGDEGGKVGVWRAGMIDLQEVSSVEERPALFPVGCCFFCRRGDFLALGGFDVAFAPFFFEDADLGYRAWRGGLRIVQLPAAVCHHEGSATLREQRTFEERERIYHRNRVLFHLRNLRDPVWRAECLGACAALALFEDRESPRLGLGEALLAQQGSGGASAEGLADQEILSRSRPQ